ncbi:MAG: Putative hydroxypyruvate reductase [Candidatus Tokpelaia hoelldobleri]|uniref:Hydroxypyruvate reductase n=1 Tax=Candidatus Tokpelaia hoelldobleri TaxID=1902579 RepID=A0A1U9JTL8_9HYPH|nr:MAG: Putative hydroxypyruvate reductase [Candidatus Tokpelaia hoelldoblerii]
MKRDFLATLFAQAVSAANPYKALKPYLPPRPKGRTIVVGTGKGAAQMAAAFETLWQEAGNGALSGLVVTRYGYAVPCKQIEICEAAHPLPDDNGLAAATRLMETVSNLTKDDLVVALVCGGGSALLPLPPEGMTLADEIALNKALLSSGAPIAAMNAIRKQFSRIKGGRLAARAYPAKVLTLAVSDIPGDEPSYISSGPTVPNNDGRKLALDFITHYRIALPARIMQFLHNNRDDTPKPDDTIFTGNHVQIIASAAQSLLAAGTYARQQGRAACILSDCIEGQAKDIGAMHAAIAREISLRNQPFTKPVVLLSGGETTVTLNTDTGNGKGGKGGRNSEFLLSFALGIDGLAGISALAADTDGIDGSENNAGAFCDGATVSTMRQAGIDPAAHLFRHDAWTAFHAVDSLFVTGATGTNVNDFRAVLIE